MQIKSGRRPIAIALAAALTLAGSACGEGDDDDAGGATSTPQASDNQFAGLERVPEPVPCEADLGVSDTEIKVGAIAVESGPGATSFAPALEGITARIDKSNQERELGSRTLTLVTRDDTGDQTRNSEVARDLVEQEQVFGIIETTNASGGSARYLNERGVPVTGWHAGVPAWATFPNMFTFRQAPADEPETEYTTRTADLLQDQGATKVALIGADNQSSALFIERVEKSIEQVGALDVVYENVSVPPEQRDFTAEVQAIKESGADGVVTDMDLVQNPALSDALSQAGVILNVITFSRGYDPRVVALPGMEGAMVGLEFYPFELDRPAFREFDEWAPDTTVRGQVPFIGWLSAEMFIQGLKEAGLNCPIRDAFIANLRLLDAYDGGGAFDPVDLSEGFGDEFRCGYYVKVEGAAFSPQFDGEAFCGDPITLE